MFLRQCKLLNGKSCEFTTTFVTSIHCVPGYTRITHRRGRGRERDLLAWEVQVPPQGLHGILQDSRPRQMFVLRWSSPQVHCCRVQYNQYLLVFGVFWLSATWWTICKPVAAQVRCSSLVDDVCGSNILVTCNIVCRCRRLHGICIVVVKLEWM